MRILRDYLERDYGELGRRSGDAVHRCCEYPAAKVEYDPRLNSKASTTRDLTQRRVRPETQLKGEYDPKLNSKASTTRDSTQRYDPRLNSKVSTSRDSTQRRVRPETQLKGEYVPRLNPSLESGLVHHFPTSAGNKCIHQSESASRNRPQRSHLRV